MLLLWILIVTGIVVMAEEAGPESALLFGGWLLLWLLVGLRLGRGRRRDGDGILRDGGLLGLRLRVLPGLGLLVDAEDALEEIWLVYVLVIAGLCGLGSIEEPCGVVVGAVGSGDEIGIFVEGFLDDALGWGEVLHVRVLRELLCAIHEISPDWQRRMRTLDVKIGVVVVADPDDTEQIAGESCEP